MKKKIIRWLLIPVLLLSFFLSARGMQSKQASMLEAIPDPANSLLQYTASGHLLGFSADKVYLTGMDHVLTVSFVDGKRGQPEGQAGSGKTHGKTASLGKVSYQNVWPGVDVIFTAPDGGIAESTYLLAPDAKVDSIRLRYNVPVELMQDGTLQFAFENGYLTESAPAAWQEIGGQHVAVAVHFEKLAENEAGFALGTYNPGYAVTIDPVFSWHTFYGSNGSDAGYDLAVDGNGNVYVTGYSSASWNGPGDKAPLHAYTGGGDILVVKLDSNGAYKWHTFYGSAGSDGGYDIALDASGNTLIAGDSSAAWNGADGQSPLNAYSGNYDVTALKLDSAGGYLWHTFHGSVSTDYGNGIAVDGSGNIYLVGYSNAAWSGPGNAPPLNPYAGGGDTMAVKLDSAGVYQWHTFYGSSASDSGSAIAADGGGNVLITGDSFAAWTGPGNTAPANAYTGSYDMTVMKLDGTGTYQWHAFLGSPSADYSTGVGADGSGNTFVIGRSSAGWNGPGGKAPVNVYSGGSDMTVVKLDSTGAFQWHTFYGSASGDYGYGLLIEPSGNITITGDSLAAWNGPGNAAPLNPYSGGYEIVAARLDGSGSYLWHSFYGSPLADDGYGIAVDGSGNVWLAGQSAAGWNGPGGAAALNPYTGGYDAVLIKIGNQPQAGLYLSANSVLENQPVGTLVGALSTVDPDIGETFTYSFCGGADDAAFTIAANQLKTAQIFAYKTRSSYAICVRSTDSGGQSIGKDFTINVKNPNDAPTDIALSKNSVDENQPAGTVIGSLSSADSNPGDTFSYSFCGGADDAAFVLDGNVLKTAALFDYEARNSYSVCVRSTDSGLLEITKTMAIQVNNLIDTATFSDVPTGYWAWKWVESVYQAGITSGCLSNPLIYCPDAPVTRAQMAVFLLRGRHGGSYAPPAASGNVFTDVPAYHWAAAWIEQLAAEGITNGCDNGKYCPEASVTRSEMAVFLLKSGHDAGYTPPAATGNVFADVAADDWAAAWIEQLAVEGITSGCDSGNYCPEDRVTRAQMAVFLQRALGLPLP